MKYCSVYVTASNEDEASRIAKVLVEEKLAACVNIIPIKSVYRWEENIEEEGEAVMFIKTRAELVDEIIERVKELHPYEVPCIVSFPIDKGNPDYLEWIEKSTK